MDDLEFNLPPLDEEFKKIEEEEKQQDDDEGEEFERKEEIKEDLLIQDSIVGVDIEEIDNESNNNSNQVDTEEKKEEEIIKNEEEDNKVELTEEEKEEEEKEDKDKNENENENENEEKLDIDEDFIDDFEIIEKPNVITAGEIIEESIQEKKLHINQIKRINKIVSEIPKKIQTFTILVFHHGIHGYSSDFSYYRQLFASRPELSQNFYIFTPKSNEGMKSRDGLDICGDRATIELLFEWKSKILPYLLNIQKINNNNNNNNEEGEEQNEEDQNEEKEENSDENEELFEEIMLDDDKPKIKKQEKSKKKFPKLSKKIRLSLIGHSAGGLFLRRLVSNLYNKENYKNLLDLLKKENERRNIDYLKRKEDAQRRSKKRLMEQKKKELNNETKVKTVSISIDIDKPILFKESDLINFINCIDPHFFMTLQTPHLGTRKPGGGIGKNLWLGLVSSAVSLGVYGRTGKQLYLDDKDKKYNEIPFITFLSSQKNLEALNKFKFKTLVSMAHHDLNVTFPSASIRSFNPYPEMTYCNKVMCTIAGVFGFSFDKNLSKESKKIFDILIKKQQLVQGNSFPIQINGFNINGTEWFDQKKNDEMFFEGHRSNIFWRTDNARHLEFDGNTMKRIHYFSRFRRVDINWSVGKLDKPHIHTSTINKIQPVSINYQSLDALSKRLCRFLFHLLLTDHLN